MVAHRAAVAAVRGFRYLQLDASRDSRLILGRLGFVALATTPPSTHPGGTGRPSSDGQRRGHVPPRSDRLRVDSATGGSPSARRAAYSRWDLRGGPCLGRKHAPLDELVGELARGHVVDDRQRPQVLGADREHLAVVATALALDGGGVPGHGPALVRRQLL